MSEQILTFEALSEIAIKELQARSLSDEYEERLRFELSEITKQGAESIWINHFKTQKQFALNPNNLVLPWLLNLTPDDPIISRKDRSLNTVRASKVVEFKEQHGFIPHDLIKDPDSPDIDIDCLPDARDPIKEYAIKVYGQNFDDGIGSVCSVGTWQTYKLKQALTDAAIALGFISPYKSQVRKGKKKKDQSDEPINIPTDTRPTRYDFEQLTAKLPDQVDELKEGGKATCKGKVIINKEEKDCGHQHDGIKCEKCGSMDTDGITIGQLLQEHEALRIIDNKFSEGLFPNGEPRPALLSTAVKLIGRIRNMGMHAGAIIITDRPLYGNIPLAKSGRKSFWVSMWTEGRNTQLSKFGYIKWDILGLKTLEYIFRCCQLIEENRGISFGKNMSGWDDIDPTQRRAGHYFDGNGEKHYINLDDPYVIKLANDQKTDAIFQFDTDLAKSILTNGVKSFEDLLFYNAAGHPGPMAAIPEAVENRDDERGLWKKRLKDIHPALFEILQDTYGIILWQEQLAAIWQQLAGFTSPEAQEARKAVAKKHTHKLKDIGKKWLAGASPIIGQKNAEEWWNKMVSFGRYAFNKSHGVSYCLVAHRCLWLKAHFAPEWWAAVMSDCHPDKLVRYMGVARAEAWSPTDITRCGKLKLPDSDTIGVEFGTLNINNLTTDFTVTGNTVNQGIIGVKGIGEKAALAFQGKGNYKSLDEFVNSAPGRQSKTVLERFIKLNSFKSLPNHDNAQALWMWYQYKYCKSGSAPKTRREINQLLLEQEGWTEAAIKDEIDRQAAEFKRQFPKRKKIPPKITNWKPKPIATFDRISALYKEDFTMPQKLEFQKQYLGYWIDSPLDEYKCTGDCTIAKAKEKSNHDTVIEGIIVDVQSAKTKTNKDYLKVYITDGIQKTLVFIWDSELRHQDLDIIQDGTGVAMPVTYDEKRGTFTLTRHECVRRLMLKTYKSRGWFEEKSE